MYPYTLNRVREIELNFAFANSSAYDGTVELAKAESAKPLKSST